MLFSYEDRVIKEGRYIVETGATVRTTAIMFGVSKSCVHKDVRDKLKVLDEQLYLEVIKVFQRNFAEKHLRGGQATRLKYSIEKSIIAK